ncbi:hypothetical protein OG613_16590 [Streptomyces sp. NBC_00015]|uniref:hypothetical protein n=1 Tax=unclassified Streptomyces TaxID=2593676 RepID=UPI002255F333|nr:hypothetical protein [Streptomyces sp. NBC_00103]MCX5369982.1 hypothetical protein [Streptomyces sp. NBC_00103]
MPADPDHSHRTRTPAAGPLAPDPHTGRRADAARGAGAGYRTTTVPPARPTVTPSPHHHRTRLHHHRTRLRTRRTGTSGGYSA